MKKIKLNKTTITNFSKNNDPYDETWESYCYECEGYTTDFGDRKTFWC